MTKSTATPRPWKAGWNGGLTGPNMANFAVYDFEGENVIPIAGPHHILVAAVPLSEYPGTAEFIVKAGNAFEPMVEALRACKIALELLKPTVDARFQIAQAEAALKLAGEE